jgi:fermentation-respiration switch protein FrsA (DUF1100 family)
VRRARFFIAATGVAMVAALPFAAGMVYLKLNESELVFRADLSRPWSNGFTSGAPDQATEVIIGLPGGAALRGYTLPGAPERNHGYWVLHLHGNADSAFSPGQLRNAQRLTEQGLSVLAFDYRGFGASAGEPSESGVYEDARAAWDWLTAQGISPDRIIIWGHSLGSGPAAWLATEVQAGALVMFGAFTSVPDRGAELYPWLPIRWIAGIRFDSLARMAHLQSPVVIAHSTTDVTIPLAHSQRLFAAATGPKRLLVLTMQRDDAFGGHVTALYDQLHLLMPLLQDVIGMPA